MVFCPGTKTLASSPNGATHGWLSMMVYLHGCPHAGQEMVWLSTSMAMMYIWHHWSSCQPLQWYHASGLLCGSIKWRAYLADLWTWLHCGLFTHGSGFLYPSYLGVSVWTPCSWQYFPSLAAQHGKLSGWPMATNLVRLVGDMELVASLGPSTKMEACLAHRSPALICKHMVAMACHEMTLLHFGSHSGLCYML